MPGNGFNQHLKVKLEGNNYRCTRCGFRVDSAAVSQGDVRQIPKDGDLSICSQCGMINQFSEDKLVPYSQDAFLLLSDEEQENLKETAIAMGFTKLRMLKSKQLES